MCVIKIKNQKFYFKTLGKDVDRPSWTKAKKEAHVFNSEEEANIVLNVIKNFCKIKYNSQLIFL